MTSHFKSLHLQSGRTIDEVCQLTFRIDTYGGAYIAERSDCGLWQLSFVPDDDETSKEVVATDLLSYDDVMRTRINHNVERLKRILQERNARNGS